MTALTELVTKAAQGDIGAFEEIYNRTYKQTHFTCMAFLKNAQDAEDVSQEVYVTAMQNISSLQDASSFEGWIGKMAVNKCINFLKRNRTVPVEDEVLEVLTEGSDELLLPEEYVMQEAKRKVLMDIMKESLSDTLYQTVLLFYFQNLSVAEIAELTECPISTVTARLCKARAKIKEGVLKYEQKSGDKLHAVALVPVLAVLFKAEAQAAEPVNMCAKVMAKAPKMMNAGKAATIGGKVMLSSWKVKIVAAILGLVLVGGGIAAAVVISGQDKEEDVRDEVVQDEEQENIFAGLSDEEDAGQSQGDVLASEETVDEAGEEQMPETEQEEAEPAEPDYYVLAQSALTQIDTFFMALTGGDAATVLAMGYEEDEFYEDFEKMCEFDCASQFLQIMYGDVKHCINEETVSDLAYYIESAYRNESKFVHVPMEYSKPLLMAFNNMYYAAYAEGEAVTPSEIVAKTNSNDEAFPILEEIMNEVPMVKAPDFWITLPDEDGNIKVILSYVMGDLEMDDLYRIDEHFPASFLCERLQLASDAIIGPGGGTFYENDEALNEMDRLLQAKDFAGVEAYLSSLTGEDYGTDYGASYGRYEDLTDTQKAFVDSFVQKEFKYDLVDYVVTADNAHNGRRFGTFLLTFPVLNDLENREIMLTDWYAENDVNEYYMVHAGVSPRVEDFETMLYYYYTVIQYAAQYVE